MRMVVRDGSGGRRLLVPRNVGPPWVKVLIGDLGLHERLIGMAIRDCVNDELGWRGDDFELNGSDGNRCEDLVPKNGVRDFPFLV